MFRYTFPEVITTNRGARCSEGNYEEQLKSVLVYGLRFDAELFTCRACLDRDEAYARVIAECTALQHRYREFLLEGTFTVEDTSPLPSCVRRGEFISADQRKKLTVLYNMSDADVDAGDVRLPAKQLYFGVTQR